MGRWLVAAVGALAFACGTREPPPAVTAPVASASADAGGYGENAKTVFDRAEEQAARAEYDEAIATFEEVKRKFAYSRYATRAEIRIADIAFKREQYALAAKLYGQWLHDHRAPDLPVDEVQKKREEAERRARTSGPVDPRQ
jgi:outer membrane protein assembly factor BamD (BamD/ComL family)